MQKLQESVFSLVKSTNLSSSVFSFLQPTEDSPDALPLGGILSDTRHGWLALGPKFCVVNLKSGLKIGARIFGASLSNVNTTVTSVVELSTPLTDNSIQLLISLQCEDSTGMVCVFHVNGSQILRCIQTDVVVTELAVCDSVPDGPFACFDGVVMAGTKNGQIVAFDLNRASLIQALKDISEGYEQLVRSETNATRLTFLPLNVIRQIEEQRDLACENDDHIAVLLNENSLVNGQYFFRNPDGSIRMKALRNDVKICSLLYIPQLGSLAVGYNFGAFQIWNILTLDLEFTSQHNAECLPVTHFGFQEPCDDPRAFCYLWVVFSLLDRFEEEEFPMAIMYSLTYQRKMMLSDTKYLYQDFSTATIRFQLDLCPGDSRELVGGRCVACNSYSVNSTLGDEGEDSMLNLCQLVWECWTVDPDLPTKYGMLLFDLDQWYKDQMPETYPLQSNAFMSTTSDIQLGSGPCLTLNLQLDPKSVSMYWHATRLDEHFYPNSLQYNCISLNTSEVCILSTIGVQRQIISSIDEIGPTILLNPTPLYNACSSAGLTPLYMDIYVRYTNQEEQRRYLLSVALEARLSRFLERCAHDWATGGYVGAGCTIDFMMDWGWKRALELKENAKELTAPLFASSTIPDRNVVLCLEHCVQQLTQLASLLDAVIKKCSNLIVPDTLREVRSQHVGVGAVALYFRVAAWFLRVGLLPERHDHAAALPYPRPALHNTYNNRRIKLHRLQDSNLSDDEATKTACKLLYIDQLIENEFGGDKIHQMWIKGGSENNGLYPPPSLYSLLRLYLLPDISEEHKHSLVLYLLVDYSMIYDEIRYEAVIRRLMQFPTMFGLSNTVIKATQAFWHLDHRDFAFALDHLQCLTGNLLSDWQHNVVLSALLAQKKTQAALQYLHVRKPPPIQNLKDKKGSLNHSSNTLYDHDKLEDWQSCSNLYLARGLVYEALDVVRMCVKNLATSDEKADVLNYFFQGCKKSGHLSKILQVTLSPFEEEVFISYLKHCNEPQTSDVLVMYYLLQARYIEAQEYNSKLKHSTARDTLDYWNADAANRAQYRDALVAVECASLPAVAGASVYNQYLEVHPVTKIVTSNPMSVVVQTKSPKNTFTYKSTFIQDAIDTASETWINKPNTRKGLKRALNIEDIPFLCTPKMVRTKSILSPDRRLNDMTPSKRPKLDLTAATPKPEDMNDKITENISMQMSMLLEMPDIQSPIMQYNERSGAETPHSILKVRRPDGMERELSPTSSRYLDSDDEMLETNSRHSHCSDSTNKHLRFSIPLGSETPSPETAQRAITPERSEPQIDVDEREKETTTPSYITTASHSMNESHPLESPPKKMATEDNVKERKRYKDTVRARRSLSISVNSSLSDDPSASIESIADIAVTLVNTRYSSNTKENASPETPQVRSSIPARETLVNSRFSSYTEEYASPKTPQGRRGIRAMGRESTPLISRSRSMTPERQDSPVATPLRPPRVTRSRSRTPELSPRSSTLEIIPEQPKQETESEPHPFRTTLSTPRPRARSRTPERPDKVIKEFRLEAITESPTKMESPPASPRTRSLRSRTPERLDKVIKDSRLEAIKESPTKVESPPASPRTRSLRSRSRTPERAEKLPLQCKLEAIKETSKTESPPDSPRTRSLRSRSRTPERTEKSTPDSNIEGIEGTSKMESPPASPRTRSQRSRSRTPEMEVDAETRDRPSSPRFRRRLRTPELISPRKERPIRTTKKPLSRMVLEANAFKQICDIPDIQTEAESSEKVERAIACTPLKCNQNVPSLMDVTFSPIVDKSILQSPNESEFTLEKEHQSTDSFEVDLKTLPAFTVNETAFAKSVLESCESSEVVESSHDDSNKIVSKVVAKSFQHTTINDTGFTQSVLNSYESSVAEITQEKSISASPKNENIPKVDDYLHEPSVSESVLKGDLSSLLTSDSDTEMRDDKDSEIQKEKNNIVEIEREINEIEGDMSASDQDSLESSVDSDDIVVEGEDTDDDDIEEEQTDEEESAGDEEETSNDANEVISIEDSSDESTSAKLQIDEDSISSKITVNLDDESEEQVAEKYASDNKESKPFDNENGNMPEDIIEVNVDIEPMDTESAKEFSDSVAHANMSLMTDDNSMQTDNDLTLTDNEKKFETVCDESAVPKSSVVLTEMNSNEKQTPSVSNTSKQYEDPLVVDAEALESFFDYAAESQNPISKGEIVSKEVTDVKEIKPTSNRKRVKSTSSSSSTKSKESTEIFKDDKNIKNNDVPKVSETTLEVPIIENLRSDSKEDSIITEQTDRKGNRPSSNRKRVKSTSSDRSIKSKESSEMLKEIETKYSKQVQKMDTEEESKNTENLKVEVVEETNDPNGKESLAVKLEQNKDIKTSTDKLDEKATTKPEIVTSKVEQPKTPMTRKRAQSMSSNKSTDQEVKTPSNAEIVTRSRSKTPTSGGVKGILTRRASKELEKQEANESVEELLTPKRRSTRIKSKNHDNESQTSEASVKSTRSTRRKSTEEKTDVKAAQVRKGRRSILKTELPAIPEVTSEDSNNKSERVMEHFGDKLTRNRRALVESWLTPGDEAASSGSEAFDVPPIDRINLLNKADFDGPPDMEELEACSSIDMSRERRARMGRAASETKTTPKTKPSRRISVDTVQAAASPPQLVSPARGRRASFTKACEALHTPKGRRLSTDKAGSESGSPASARRSRRQSATTQPDAEE